MESSNLFRLGWKDIINGLIMFVGTAVLSNILYVLQSGELLDWKKAGTIAITAAIIYLLKNVFTDDSGKLVGKI
jgi:hypothetical protein